MKTTIINPDYSTEIKFLNNDFDLIWNKILKKENIAFMRNADGEHAIMTGKAVSAQEGNWKSPDYITKLGEAIHESLHLDNENVYYAISCPCCDLAAYNYYRSRINNKNITFANLWINKNYQKFLNEFPKISRDAILIANYKAANKKIGNLNIIKHYHINDDCISFWDNDATTMLETIKSDFGSKNDLLYIVSAGPMSGPIIYDLYKNNPLNCYIDFGSSIDAYYRHNITRPYMKKNNKYAKRNCWMHKLPNINSDISVVCTLFKKPESLILQLKAINEQTIKPIEIILFQDMIPKDYSINLHKSILEKFDNVKISDVNSGVWERFNYAKNAKGKYICIFDDDTIPGSRWLENCLFNINKKEGIYGTLGIILKNKINYPFNNFFKVGWDNPINKTIEVDFVGHSWFFKKKWLHYMFENTDEYQIYKYVAEDMCLSFQAQRYNIKTFVPAHPLLNKKIWGSNPRTAKCFGTSPAALSSSKKNLILMNKAINKYYLNGWQPLFKRNKLYINKIYIELFIMQFIGIIIKVLYKLKQSIK